MHTELNISSEEMKVNNSKKLEKYKILNDLCLI